MASRPALTTRPSSVAGARKTIVLVTGGNAGIGYEIVKSLSKLPEHQVLMGCRDTRKGEEAASSMGAPINVNPIQLDVTNDESIEHAFKTIEQTFGKLDILINNAGVNGLDKSHANQRQMYHYVYDVNVFSADILTNTLVPMLEKSKLPKVIFVSSTLGSIGSLMEGPTPPLPYREYGSSKAALDHIAAFYSKQYPKWKVNAVCPGLRATKLGSVEHNEDTDPALGAVRVTQLVQDGLDGVTGTFSRTEGSIPW